MRGPFNHDSWRRMEDLRYNDPGLKGNKRYGTVKNFDSKVLSICLLPIRSVAGIMWPHYKVFVPDPLRSTQDLQGGETPWYVYRSAEVYLMMAECYYWKGDATNEAAYVKRGSCTCGR